MAAPATPTGGSPRLGPAFSPKAATENDATPPARRVGDSTASREIHEAHAGGAGCEGETGPSVRCPYCDEVLPLSLLARIRGTEPPALDPAASEGLQASVHAGDGAETGASRASITVDDIRRWSERAGVEIPGLTEQSNPKPTPQEDAKPIPVLAPPPPPSSKLSASTSLKNKSSRFGFFSRKQESDDEEDDLDDLVSGYSKLEEGPDDDDTYEEKPIVFKKRDPEEQRTAIPPPPQQQQQQQSPLNHPTTAVAAGASEPELRLLLKEVLNRVQSLTQSHSELASSHTALLTSLKIARSNLVMAEANTEMLESELKRAKASATPASAVPSRARPSLEGRPSTDSSPKGAPLTASQSGKSFGFWARKASPLPSPSLNSSVSGQEDGDELSRLRETVATQASQLDHLKQGKKEIEAELENLSQALFEEANKMVADERKRRAELEENLREARDEREALRATIKVLGGSAPGTEANSDDDTEGSSVGGDLTAHYAALRAGIDRVGARTPQPSPLANEHEHGHEHEHGSGSGRTTPDANGDRAESPADEMPGGFGRVTPPSPPPGAPKGSAAMSMPPAPVPLETEANPWG